MNEKRTPKREPWWPAVYDVELHPAAIKACYFGTATPEQQTAAMAWIIDMAAQTADQSFYPGDTHVSAFIEGRRSVGNQIMKLVKFKRVNANTEQP